MQIGNVMIPPRPTGEDITRQARELEGSFLAEMLRHAGLEGDRASNGPEGGMGEAQFTSFLTQARAQALAGSGGIGLARHFVRVLTAGRDDG